MKNAPTQPKRVRPIDKDVVRLANFVARHVPAEDSLVDALFERHGIVRMLRALTCSGGDSPDDPDPAGLREAYFKAMIAEGFSAPWQRRRAQPLRDPTLREVLAAKAFESWIATAPDPSRPAPQPGT